MYEVIASNQFGKDYKKCAKRHLPTDVLDELIMAIAASKILPAKYKIHKLSGVYKNCWECHIQPDWLLIWQVHEDENLVQLIRTGTHSDLFK